MHKGVLKCIVVYICFVTCIFRKKCQKIIYIILLIYYIANRDLWMEYGVSLPVFSNDILTAEVLRAVWFAFWKCFKLTKSKLTHVNKEGKLRIMWRQVFICRTFLLEAFCGACDNPKNHSMTEILHSIEYWGACFLYQADSFESTHRVRRDDVEDSGGLGRRPLEFQIVSCDWSRSQIRHFTESVINYGDDLKASIRGLFSEDARPLREYESVVKRNEIKYVFVSCMIYIDRCTPGSSAVFKFVNCKCMSICVATCILKTFSKKYILQ